MRQNPWTAFDPQGLDDEKKSNPKPKAKTPEKSESVDKGAAGSDLISNDISQDTKLPRSESPKEQSPTETSRELREEMAQKIVDMEARRDKDGNMIPYELPSNDGGGSYEVAGINEKYHPEMAAKLKELTDAGRYQEAEAMARDYIADYTDRVGSWTNQPSTEFFLRDTAFNRGVGGATKVLQEAVGVKIDGKMGPQTLKAAAQADKNPQQMLGNLRKARESYENRVAPGRPNLRRGLENRWNNAQTHAETYLPQ